MTDRLYAALLIVIAWLNAVSLACVWIYEDWRGE